MEMTDKQVEEARDGFGLSHDLLIQAQFPGHVAKKVANAVDFLEANYKYYNDELTVRQAQAALKDKEEKEKVAMAAAAQMADAPKQ